MNRTVFGDIEKALIHHTHIKITPVKNDGVQAASIEILPSKMTQAIHFETVPVKVVGSLHQEVVHASIIMRNMHKNPHKH
ncbi:hypothetical protein BGX34_006556 [Mortierella sp. NVP85]|nr:hypothetical protein BGX34_006556 [Mortierella sp. NVP85]